VLFALNYTIQTDANESRDRRMLKLLSAWKPPAGFDMKGWYDYADGGGGVAIVEAPTAEVLLEGLSPWTTFIDFRARPIVSVEKSTPIFERGLAWRDSIR
jgi:hypothetical protein